MSRVFPRGSGVSVSSRLSGSRVDVGSSVPGHVQSSVLYNTSAVWHQREFIPVTSLPDIPDRQPDTDNYQFNSTDTDTDTPQIINPASTWYKASQPIPITPPGLQIGHWYHMQISTTTTTTQHRHRHRHRHNHRPAHRH